MTIDLDLEAHPRAAAEARRRLDRLSLEEDLLQDLRLLVSELVANSVRYGDLRPGDRISVAVEVRDDRVHVEVEDPGRGTGSPHMNGHDGGGWGLRLVDRLADRWGVGDEDRTVVWFELRRRGPPRSTTRRQPTPGT